MLGAWSFSFTQFSSGSVLSGRGPRLIQTLSQALSSIVWGGRAPLVRAPALPLGPAGGRCGEAVLLEPALGTKRGVQARSRPRARLRADRSLAGQVKGVAEPTVAGAQLVSGEAPGSFRSPAALAPQDPTPSGWGPHPRTPGPWPHPHPHWTVRLMGAGFGAPCSALGQALLRPTLSGSQIWVE